MIAGIYVRVWTLNQVDRDSLSTQESRLRAYCDANEYSVREVYKDAGFSAKDTNRPALQRLYRDIKAGRVQAVLVTKLDRIIRSLRDLVKLVDFFSEHSVKFISITQNVDSSDPFGRFMRDLLGLIAQLEREETQDTCRRLTPSIWKSPLDILYDKIPQSFTFSVKYLKSVKSLV